MTDPDDLSRAAQRAREVLRGPIGDCVAAKLEIYEERQREDRMEGWRAERAHALAVAVLALPVSAPDRAPLVEAIRKAISAWKLATDPADFSTLTIPEAVADALIAAGLVRTPAVTAEVSAVNLAGILTFAADLGTESWQEMAGHLLRRYEIRERPEVERTASLSVVEGDEHGTR